MTSKDLIEAAKAYCDNPENIKAMTDRAKEAEKKFEQQTKDRRPSGDWWNRVYEL